MEIRRNDTSALPAFAALNMAWIKDLHHVEASDQKMADHPEIYTQNGNSVFSVHIDGEIAGVCALKKDIRGDCELTKMAVDPRFQGRGLGKVLLTAAQDYARGAMGLNRIYLLSNTANAAALRLYEREGWAINHQGTHPDYARCNIGMEKFL
jgi:GNAT superfamily N-acetyltransferase